MIALGDVYRDRRVLVTGHTGFKGSWLSLWLQTLGAELAGVALSPNTMPNHWDQLGLRVHEARMDVRDAAPLKAFVQAFAPEVIFHLAAQPLVRRSYADPLETWSTNVMGTANVLEACRELTSVKAIVVVTTDKCYENREWAWGYRETDSLGGHDPYSASKAATELLVKSYRSSFYEQPASALVATARAGNVIGGGDWSADRLVPDIARATSDGRSVSIRYPNATRPWQHVLDSLHGYLMLGAKLLGGERRFAEAWNFGPDSPQASSVTELLLAMKQQWPALRWHVSDSAQLHETSQLTLDNAKSRQGLGWRPVWDLAQSIQFTAEWYHRFLQTGEIASRQQLDTYTRMAAG